MKVAEIVGHGHPDKIADGIAETVRAYFYRLDKDSRVACEVLATHNKIYIAGEINCRKKGKEKDLILQVRCYLLFLRFTDQIYIEVNLKQQSEEIIDYSIKDNLKSGDQSIVYGYATNATNVMLPLEYVACQYINLYLHTRGKEKGGETNDWKIMVQIEDKDLHVLCSIQEPKEGINKIKELLTAHIKKFCMKYNLNLCKIQINPAGSFTIGGLEADTGVTNRKLMVDAYGPSVHHGGGGFNGKDLTKVDRLGAYFARGLCVQLVSAKICEELEIALIYKPSYSIPTLDIINYRSRNYTKAQIRQCLLRLLFPLNGAYSAFNYDKTLVCSHLSIFGHFTEAIGNTNFKLKGIKEGKDEQKKCNLS